jgi:hypothetical protein
VFASSFMAERKYNDYKNEKNKEQYMQIYIFTKIQVIGSPVDVFTVSVLRVWESGALHRFILTRVWTPREQGSEFSYRVWTNC